MADKSEKRTPTSELKAFEKEGERLNVVIETPKGSRNKFKYDEANGVFCLSGVLPAGAVFPFDFGYVPDTRAEDGDPIDALVLMDVPAFAGCLIPCRLIGSLKAEQTEEGKTTRNDRLLAVAADAHDFAEVRSWRDLTRNLVHDVEHFFVSYNSARGRKFHLLGIEDPEGAWESVRQAVRRKQEA